MMILERFRAAAACCVLAFMLAGGAAAADDVAAVVNGRRISYAELDQAAAAKLYAIEQQKYVVRKAALDAAIADALVEQEAAKRNLTPEAFRAELMGPEVEVPAETLEERYAESVAGFGSMSPAEAKERLRADLASQARMRRYREQLAALREKAVVTIVLAEPRLPLPAADEAPSLGNAQAAVTVTLFSDYTCSFCKAAQQPLRELVREHGDGVRVVFRHLPLRQGGPAADAAAAAVCAQRQGVFRELNDLLFAGAARSAAAIREAAGTLGVDRTAFEDCLDAASTRAEIAADVRLAKLGGVTGTPAFFVNGRRVPPGGVDAVRRAVEAELTDFPRTHPPTGGNP
jgi:protein-disulfide isomerase